MPAAQTLQGAQIAALLPVLKLPAAHEVQSRSLVTLPA